MDASQYSITATLRDGSSVEIRAQRPGDREGIRSAFGQMGGESIQRRFFAPRRSFSEREVKYFLDIDFVQQVALLAVAGETIVGGGRYIVTEPGVAEVAFSVADDWQGRGLGGLLLAHLIAIARQQGLRQFVAEVLAENSPMLAVFRKSGLPMATHREAGVVHATLALAT
jgi:GNAT superfamily N-acetyltransferase